MAEINIFISYKHEFKESAVKIRDAIKFIDDKHKIEIFMDSDIPAGTKWLDWIKCHIGMSNILLFLFGEPSSNWDWCLFEAGMFLRTGDNTRRVICIHHPDFQPPAQLQDLQSIPADLESMKGLLDDLFTGVELTNLDEPLYPDLVSCFERIGISAETICKEFVPKKIGRRDYDKFIDIEILDTEKIKEPVIPKESKIESSLDSMEIFGLETNQISWEEFLQSVADLGDQRWIAELQDVIIKAIKKKRFNPMQATISGWNGHTYIPVLSAAEFFSNNSVKLHVHFIDNVSSRIMELPIALGILQTCLQFGVRFRYEVLLKSKSYVSEPHSEEELRSNRKNMLNTIASMETEAKSRGSLSMAAIVMAFSEPEEQAKVQSMLLGWQPMKEKLLESLSRDKREEAKAVIKEIVEVNSQFLVLVSDRYHQLLRELLAVGE